MGRVNKLIPNHLQATIMKTFLSAQIQRRCISRDGIEGNFKILGTAQMTRSNPKNHNDIISMLKVRRHGMLGGNDFSQHPDYRGGVNRSIRRFVIETYISTGYRSVQLTASISNPSHRFLKL